MSAINRADDQQPEKKHRMMQRMSRQDKCCDNIVAESFFRSKKNELLHHRSIKNRDETRMAIFEYIEVYYNHERRNQSLDYLSPLDYENSMAVA